MEPNRKLNLITGAAKGLISYCLKLDTLYVFRGEYLLNDKYYLLVSKSRTVYVLRNKLLAIISGPMNVALTNEIPQKY